MRDAARLAIVFLGAFASIATVDAPKWGVDEFGYGPELTLSPAQRRLVVPISLRADGVVPGVGFEIQIVGEAIVDGPETPGPDVRASVVEVGSLDPPEEQTVDAGGSERNDFYLQYWLRCRAESCAHEVEATFESDDPRLSGDARIVWYARYLAVSYGEPAEPPPDLALEISIGNPSP